MKKLLFINACVRGKEVSRTYELAQKYLEEITKGNEYEVEELDLMKINPEYHTYSNFSEYNEKAENGVNDPENFLLAKQFADSDYIVIAAPFWEFSFPAILSSYIENISVANIAFKYTERGSQGLCKASKLVYICTIGDYIRGENDGIGEKLLKRLSQLYGIPEFEAYYAQGLDAWEANVEEIMEEAKKEIASSL